MDQTMSTAISFLLTIGGMFGALAVLWRLRAWLQYKWMSTPKTARPKNVVAAALASGGTPPSLAQRKDTAEDQALSTHNQYEKSLDYIAELLEEQEQREELVELAKVRRRRGGVNALKEAWLDNRTPPPGPMTTFISQTELELANLKKAKAERDAALSTLAPKS